MECKNRALLVLFLALTVTSCTFNPFTTDNQLTGSAASTAVGAGVGAGAAWLGGGNKSLIAAAGITGALVGYYASTLRFEAGGIIANGGQVFSQGDFLAIEIPSDRLFDVNTAEFLDDVDPVLGSVVQVLKRYPYNNIIVSGNTSGFGTAKFEHKISEDRARQVAGYLWSHGIGDFQGQNPQTRVNFGSLKTRSLRIRKLTYVGYGNYFPIANDIRNKSIRQNSRIQITAYPTFAQIGINKCMKACNNLGALNEPVSCQLPLKEMIDNQFPNVIHESSNLKRNEYGEVTQERVINNSIIPPDPPGHSSYHKERRYVKDENVWGNLNNIAKDENEVIVSS